MRPADASSLAHTGAMTEERRRAADAMPLRFKQEDTAASPEGHDAAEVETIDLDVAPPPGGASHDDVGDERTVVALTPEQRLHRTQLAKFMKTFSEYAVRAPLTRIDIEDVKRGDVVSIKTIVGTVYLEIVDRLKARRGSAGQILCRCRYDLGDQCTLVHMASVELPLCSHKQLIASADGTMRPASRKLRFASQVEVPAHVLKLLDERFITELAVHSNPTRERFRPIDAWRAVAPVVLGVLRGIRWLALKLVELVRENNRREREKKAQREAEAKRRKEARAQEKAARQAARDAGKRKP